MPRLGAAHHHAKLTDAQVRDMRRLYAEWRAAKSRKGYGALAEIYGCGVSTVRDMITLRTRWAA